ncbi:DUF1800 domain-containing protein [Parvularcula sp. BGMRC 0090]|uniref:DUF1800 domain-containing protein n=2 Tax=Parvularcula maris TaxID=2965077 RepID=A0A9X2LA04_9PROT|nr:DUF1800 domain-containing protein [Parvularcula maris]MCQ8185875.1 DUF1800 domain-containing protein [Parvularcula maris]
MATFGPVPDEVARLTGTDASAWIKEQFALTRSPYLSEVEVYYGMGTRRPMMLADGFDQGSTSWVFWRNAAQGEDQLRQRMIFALSQVLVVSNGSGGLLGIFPQTLGRYQEILSEHAFGNYRDLLEDVTYSVAMAEYLTYLGNQKGDSAAGRVPDENYAREILQLFTIGLVELNPDGTPRLGPDGKPIELYTNEDITGLARVFTGLASADLSLDLDGIAGRIPTITTAVTQPLPMIESRHSPKEKSFLGTTIPENTPGRQSISLALDHIMDHPNVGPFVGRQIIQRFVTSNPSPAYVERVAAAFDQGLYTLPDGALVGEGRKGDLAATIAAILFDDAAQPAAALPDDQFGKVREPVIRLVHFMRAFDTDMSSPEYVRALYDTAPINVLGQHPFRSPSVFNFYRPGYVAPGTLSGELGLHAPELQIVNASSTPGYINLLSYGAFGTQREEFASMRPVFTNFSVPFDQERARTTFVPDYTEELALVDDPAALIDHLDNLLLYGSMTADTRRLLIETMEELPHNVFASEDGREDAVAFAVTMVMSSPDYLVQR